VFEGTVVCAIAAITHPLRVYPCAALVFTVNATGLAVVGVKEPGIGKSEIASLPLRKVNDSGTTTVTAVMLELKSTPAAAVPESTAVPVLVATADVNAKVLVAVFVNPATAMETGVDATMLEQPVNVTVTVVDVSVGVLIVHPVRPYAVDPAVSDVPTVPVGTVMVRVVRVAVVAVVKFQL
jgi:hypothetical protein